MAEETIQILMVEDNPTDQLLVREELAEFASLRFELSCAERLEAGLELLAGRPFDVALLDLSLPDAQGLETVRRMHERFPLLPIVVLTGLSDERLGLEAVRQGAQDYLVKGQISAGLLGRALRFAIERKRAEEAIVARERNERALEAMRREEHTLRQSEERFRMMAEAAPQLVWTARPDGQLDYFNSRLTEFSGMSAELAVAGGWVQVLHPEDRDRTLAAWREAVRSGALYQAEQRLRRVDGEFHWHISRALPVRDAQGAIVRWFGSTTDIHAQKAAEAKLLAADRRKDEFLAMLSHELRNPLAPIRYAVELLRLAGAGNAVIQSQREVIDRQVTHMGRLLDDLLEVSRITRGKIRLQKERVDLRLAVGEAVEAARPAARARRHHLALQNAEAPLWVEGDYTRLVQVIANLLGNAIKYTDEGGAIVVRAAREDGFAAVRVRDSGVGIPPDILPHIFDLFIQADRTLDRSQGGLGIGLTLVQRLVAMHGGRVEAASEGPGQGSEFLIRLPLRCEAEAPVAAARAGAASRPAAQGWRVLVVDDNKDSANSLCELLELWGYPVRAAYDGATALALAAEFQPRVALLDIGMPGMDGYELARRLREGRGADELMLVALTGYGQEDSRRLGREAGFDRHLVKPVALDALRKALAEGMAGAGGESDAPPARPENAVP